MTRAQSFFEKGDYKRATIDAKSALVFDSSNKEAIRLVAKSLEAMNSPGVMEWRAMLGRLAPDDVENTISWAAICVKNGDYQTADRLLGRIPGTDRDTALYHHLAGAVAMNKRDAVKAEYHWSEAAKLNPADDVYKLNMATARLRLGSALERANALELLNQLRLKESERIPALRALISDAIGHLEIERAKELAKALADDPKALFSDRLLRLSTLHAVGDPDFKIWRARMEAEAVEKPEYAYQLIIWMNRNAFAKEVPALISRMPVEVVTKPPVSIGVADAYAVAKDWQNLREVLERSQWHQMDYVRLATLAWAAENSGDHGEATAQWKKAVAAASGTQNRMETLAKAALAWGWEQRAEEALWAVTAGSHCPNWVLQALWGRALKRGETDKLQRIARLMVTLNPKSVAARNNYIFLSLLTRNSEGSPHVAAEALYHEYPSDPSVVSTYALSLVQLGRARAATEALETLKPEQLREPSVAIYYGSFLIAARRGSRAEEFLKLGAKWPLLPEEQAMFERIRRDVAPYERGER